MWDNIKSFFTSMPLELTPDEETEMIEKISRKIAQRKMELPALLFLEPYEPVSALIGETFLVWISPVLDFVGIDGYRYSLLLRKKENIKRLRGSIKKIIEENQNSKKRTNNLEE